MKILGIYLKEQLLIKYYVINLLVLLKNPKYDGYRRGIVSLVYKFLDEESSGVGIIQNQE